MRVVETLDVAVSFTPHAASEAADVGHRTTMMIEPYYERDGSMTDKCYVAFLDKKRQFNNDCGFEPLWIPDWLIDFQKSLVEWSIRKGRAAILADCGLGKTPMQLVWASNVVRKRNKPVLILTPLAVAQQTFREAEKFGIDAKVSRDGKICSEIVITNYDMLHKFEREQFSGIVCDESSILKNLQGATRKYVTRFMNKMPYRLLCTATAAPNDYVELGTSSEALGELNYSEMLKRFFKQLDDKGQKKERKQQDEAEALIAGDPNYFRKLAYRVAQTIGQWRLRHHAVQDFWRWVSSWARACRKPSDIGFDDGAFVLPPLHEHIHIIKPSSPPPGMLFTAPVIGMHEERKERRRTLQERCEYVAKLVDHDEPAIVWCHMNPEGDLLERIIPGARQIAGRTPDDEKLELYEAFVSGELNKLVIKPKIGAWGLNWQHCNHVVTFVSHSYEQYYQSVRRCWRFGQEKEVNVDVVATFGEERIIGNVERKAKQADAMFAALVREMANCLKIDVSQEAEMYVEIPQWL